MKFMSFFRLFFLILMLPFGISGQNYTSYIIGNKTDLLTFPQGGVCIMGGGAENDDAMKWFLQQSSGGDVLVLRTTGDNGYNNYLYQQLKVKVNSVETIVFNNKQASEEHYIHQKIMQAEAIWFAGGDQWDYISFWRNTKIDSLINDAILTRNIVIGGTSAGMAIQGGLYFTAQNGTVTSAEALANPYNSRMKIDSAVFLKNKYLENVITDTHYDDPDRRGRHSVFLGRILSDWNIQARGIASEANSAICIDPSGIARCYGDYPKYDDNLYFLQPNCENASSGPENCTIGNPLEWNRDQQAIKVYKVKGTSTGNNYFDLNDWKTGTGGTWENWYIIGGVLYTNSGSEINCSTEAHNNPLKGEPEIRVYPNPLSDDKLNLQFQGIKVEKITIFDVCGKVVKTIDGQIIDSFCIDISDLKPGVFVLVLQTNPTGIRPVRFVLKSHRF